MTLHTLPESAEARAARLEGIIADAIAALDERRLGDLRSILVSGSPRNLKPLTAVLARNGGAG